MMARQWEDNVLPLCKELGIGFIAYVPLTGGFLSGKYDANTEFKGDDIRTQITRYKKENVEKYQPLLNLENFEQKCLEKLVWHGLVTNK